MLALRFRFPAGRYHATPWGRNVNEADVAWPPEPWRILRALIAAYWCKGDRERWPETALARLIDALADMPPSYAVPEGAVHVHTRHYMPQGRGNPKLVFDAFLRLRNCAQLVVVWPSVTLDVQLYGLVADLASAVGYIGRAESWTECEALDYWKGVTNCGPKEDGFAGVAVRLLAPLSASAYATERERLIREERRRVSSHATKPQSEKALDRAIAKTFVSKRSGLDTMPEQLLDALSLDTADWQGCGWSRPPAAREVLYARAENAGAIVAPAISARRTRAREGRSPTVARFILAGRPRPRIEDTVKIAELMRLAALSKFGWERDVSSDRLVPRAPAEISGRGIDGKPLRDDPSHAHAFWLPEDADSDGLIDHVSVFIAGGMASGVRAKLDQITRLWLESRPRLEGESDVASAEEWRLALEGFGQPSDFDDSPIFGRSTRWRSATPFLAAGHLKDPGYPGYERELRRLFNRIGMDSRFGFDAGDVSITGLQEIMAGGMLKRALHFHRFRSRRRGKQPDTAGALVEVVFPVPVDGPLALGFASHFGLGLFVRDGMP